MFYFVNSFLLWGLLAVSVPIFIHLLLRQRPRSRPWAAMRWLQMAVQAAQRRYRITNLLLLLLRCLIVALLVLAVARPHFGFWQQGGDIVLLIDVSASMGSDSRGHGALESAKKMLLAHTFTHQRVCVVSVGAQLQVLSNGSVAAAMRSIQSLHSDDMPGGLQRIIVNEDMLHELTAALRPHSTLVCISDFRQDDGMHLVRTLRPSVRTVTRWQVGSERSNSFVRRIPDIPDCIAGHAQHLAVHLNDTHALTSIHMAIDGGSTIPVSIQNPLMLSLPPLQAGKHTLSLTFEDHSLSYDNTVHIGLHARGAIPCMIVQKKFGYLAAASDAATQQLAYTAINPVRFAHEPLHDGGIVVLDSPIGSQERLWKWMHDNGGIACMWSDHFFADQYHQTYAPHIQPSPHTISGVLQQTGDEIFNRSFTSLPFDALDALTLTGGTEDTQQVDTHTVSLLQCVSTDGHSAPLIVRSAVGSGYVIVISASLRQHHLFWTQGIVPFFWRTLLRRSAARAQRPLILEAGSPAPYDLHAHDSARKEYHFTAGSPILTPPRLLHISEQSPPHASIIILPQIDESMQHLPTHPHLSREMHTALPAQSGSDWSLWILLLVLGAFAIELMYAARAGRRYGQ